MQLCTKNVIDEFVSMIKRDSVGRKGSLEVIMKLASHGTFNYIHMSIGAHLEYIRRLPRSYL